MACFSDDDELQHRPDYELLQTGPITLFFKTALLDEKLAWLREHQYKVAEVDCSGWKTEQHLHAAIADTLAFPDYYGQNLDALNDCLKDVEIPAESGLVLAFRRYDNLARIFHDLAFQVLDIIAYQSRNHLLFGRRFIILVQSDDPSLSFPSVGACPVTWNSAEFLNRNRGV